MGWVLFGDRLTARNLTKSHSKSSKNFSADAGLILLALRAEIYKSMEIHFLAGCGGKSNPINLYKVSLLRAMDWVLFGDRLTARNLTKSHSKSSKNFSAGTGLLFSPLWRAKSINLWKLLSLRELAGCGGKSNPINLYKVSLLRAMGWVRLARVFCSPRSGEPKSINLWKLLSLRGLAGCGVG